MNYLLDTHIFIWAMEGNIRLPKDIKDQISNSENRVFVSVATVWEMILKKRKGLKVPADIQGSIQEANFTTLSINVNHVLEVENLPNFHKDPFDRILISQAKLENLTLITSDQKIWKYRTPLIKVS